MLSTEFSCRLRNFLPTIFIGYELSSDLEVSVRIGLHACFPVPEVAAITRATVPPILITFTQCILVARFLCYTYVHNSLAYITHLIATFIIVPSTIPATEREMSTSRNQFDAAFFSGSVRFTPFEVPVVGLRK